MSVHAFSDAQVAKARHALGLSRGKVAYRNFYVCDDDADWNDLVSRGFATKRKSPVSAFYVYHISARAKFFFLNRGDSIDPETKFPEAPSPPEAKP